jgi:hypothetical protein
VGLALPKRSVLNLCLLLFGVFIVLASFFGREQFSSDSVQCVGDRTSNRGVPRHSPKKPAIDPDCTIEAVSAAEDVPDAAPLSARINTLPSEEQDYGVRMAPAPVLQMPFWVDSNSPMVWAGDRVHFFNSAFEETYRSAGKGIYRADELKSVTLPRPDRPGNVWIEAVWRDPRSQVLYGWYHFEPADLICLTAPLIGAAVSMDDGLTWQDKGFVLESGGPVDCDYGNGYFTGGNGDFSVVPSQDNEWLYFIYTNYAGPKEEQGIAVARSRLEDRGQPGTVYKYFRGDFSEPGMGGSVTPVFGVDRDWSNADVDALWGPSVHWNSYLKAYVALMNRAVGEFWVQDGIYIASTHDFVHWTFPTKLLDTPDWYPQVVGISPGETDAVAGRTARLFVGGYSEALIEFSLVPKEPTMPGPGEEAPPGQSDEPVGRAEPER